jgi:hypothetical protein
MAVQPWPQITDRRVRIKVKKGEKKCKGRGESGEERDAETDRILKAVEGLQVRIGTFNTVTKNVYCLKGTS